jgi:hypothetical protein
MVEAETVIAGPARLKLDNVAIFAFRSAEAADSVLAGATKRLATAATRFAGWFHGVSAGMVAAAVEAEAAALSYEFAVG